MNTQTRMLIVNADDFGLNQAANAGIVECHRAGSVTSTTLMANAPGLEEAVELSRSHPSLGIGLHFNLTWGRPLVDSSAVPALVDETGAFLSREALGTRSVLGRVPPDQIRMELQAQFDRLRGLGIDVTHVDSHQHVHALGPVFHAMASLCSQQGLPMRVPWVARERTSSVRRRIRRAILASLLRKSVVRWRGKVRWNDGLGSVFDVGASGEALDASHYSRILRSGQGSVFELMVHPVTSAAAMHGYTRVGAIGESEYCWLRTGQLRGLAESLGFRLGTYRDLRA